MFLDDNKYNTVILLLPWLLATVGGEVHYLKAFVDSLRVPVLHQNLDAAGRGRGVSVSALIPLSLTLLLQGRLCLCGWVHPWLLPELRPQLLLNALQVNPGLHRRVRLVHGCVR